MGKRSIIQTEVFINNRFRRFVLPLVLFFIFYLFSYLIDPYAAFWLSYFDQDFKYLIVEWLATFIFCFLISETSVLIHTKLNVVISWNKSPIKRLLLESFLNLFTVLLLILINIYLALLLYKDQTYYIDTWSIENRRSLIQWGVVSVLISLITISINTGRYLILNWMNIEKKVAEHKLRESKLRQASIEAELHALKLQLDPHFIFNNLSVLSELILENQQVGYQYSENFAKVYRYLLVNSKRDVISLEEELKFISSYMFLIKQRIREGVHFEVNLTNQSKLLYIPPLTLQLLIENALKHNKTSKSNPLTIKIYNISDDVLCVENNLLLIDKSAQLNSTGIGLNNIFRRFKLLSHKTPEVITSTESFKVNVYLIKYDK